MEIVKELFDAVKAGDAARVKALIRRDPSAVNARNDRGMTPLAIATYFRRAEVVDLLVAGGAEMDIFAASALGRVERLRALLEADRTLLAAYSPDGWTPLHLAAHFGHTEAARLLVASGADIHVRSRNPTDNTPLHAAVAGRHAGVPPPRQRDVVALLLASGANVNGRFAGGGTTLHLAAHEGITEVVELLLAHGADVTAQNNDGQTPLRTALREGHTEVADLLRLHGGTE